MTLLAIDPGRSYKGEATIGYCLFTDAGEEIERGSLTWEELIVRFDGMDEYMWFTGQRGKMSRVSTVVIEDFVNDPKSARGGQRNGTSECIGGVEMVCGLTRTPMYRQRSDALGPAKMHAPKGSWKDLKHLRHEDSAYLHGYEFLVRRGVLQSAGLEATILENGRSE